MTIPITLEEMSGYSNYVPLAVVGYCFSRTRLLQPLWQPLELRQKSYDHAPTEKLQDVIVAIMAGCRSLHQVNIRLRPDIPLATAWQRPCFADQSVLSRQLDDLSPQHIEQLRAGHLALLQQHSQLHRHNWQQALMLDVDATSLLASKRARGSRKGWVTGRHNLYCRHVLRFTLAGYHESLISLTYPGDRHAFEYFKPACRQLLHQWTWPQEQRQQIVFRSDAGLGTDANISYILWAGFQVLMKGYSGRRTQAWLKHIPETAWLPDPSGGQRWGTQAPQTLRLGRRLDAYLLRWASPKRGLQHATLLSTLPFPLFSLWDLYDGRGATEVEIRSDKSGLGLHLRRKRSFTAMEAWIILTDVAHNLLAWLQPWMVANTAFDHWGPKRIVQDLFAIPGQLHFDNGRLCHIALLRSHPYAAEMRLCLQNLTSTFEVA